MSGIEIDLSSPLRPGSFRHGMFVLYRDPVKFLAGESDHTAVCRVRPVSPDDFVEMSLGRLVPVEDIRRPGQVRRVDPAYVRAVSPELVMRDIDTAPLDDPAAMLSAGDAWVRRNHPEDPPTT